MSERASYFAFSLERRDGIRHGWLLRIEMIPFTTCWIWTGSCLPSGYGTLGRSLHNKHVNLYAHRLSYEIHKGPIPDGLHIDHLCRVRSCVNPAHLEAVTSLENNARGFGIPAENSRKRSCQYGHKFTFIERYKYRSDGRRCRMCQLLRERMVTRKRLATIHIQQLLEKVKNG